MVSAHLQVAPTEDDCPPSVDQISKIFFVESFVSDVQYEEDFIRV